ncbi:MAG: aminoacyl-tRNA hydrolase [Bacteroidia bacterium]|nr:aminoacyl-tRNA hydrolase [Bacteroidia bacterium]
MKYLIVGLGNIGKEYERTRHNIGFRIVDELARNMESSWSTERLGEVTEVLYKGRKFVLLKPNTYMNLSGKSVHYHLQRLKLSTEELLVITDDLSLSFGTLRMRGQGSDGGHNGLANIQEYLNTTNYPRLRVGIGSNFPRGRQVDYVLSPFSPAEEELLPKVLETASQAVLSFGLSGLSHTMNQFNKKVI